MWIKNQNNKMYNLAQIACLEVKGLADGGFGVIAYAKITDADDEGVVLSVKDSEEQALLQLNQWLKIGQAASSSIMEGFAKQR